MGQSLTAGAVAMAVATCAVEDSGSDVLGLGVDVVDVADFDRLPFPANEAFYRRCFTDVEIAYCQSQIYPAQHFAVRFAAKEAAVKALNEFLPLGYWQVEVQRDERTGAPHLQVWNELRTAPPSQLEPLRLAVSLSHARSIAIAVVLVSRRRTPAGE